MVKFHDLTPDSENHCDLVIIYLFVYKKDQLGRSACCSPETDLPKQKNNNKRNQKLYSGLSSSTSEPFIITFVVEIVKKYSSPLHSHDLELCEMCFFPMCKNSGYFLHGIFKIWHLKKVSLPFLPFSLQSESPLCLSSQNQIHQKDQHPK